MGTWRGLIQGLRSLLHRRDAERDVADEVRHFLEEAEDEMVARGASRREARRAVRLRYGEPACAVEEVRASVWESQVDTLVADLRLSVRSLRRSPGFATVVVLSLGLGIGSVTAIYSAVRPALFAPLAYPRGDRILWVDDFGQQGSLLPVTFGTYVEVSRRSSVFESLAVFKPWQPTLAGADGGREPQRLEGQSVSAAYFTVLGVRPALGPGFDEEEDRPGGLRQVILGDALWRTSFGGDPALVGRTIPLDGERYRVVGVMGRALENVTAPASQLWTLLQYDALLPSADGPEWGHHLRMIGRMRDGLTLDEARRSLATLAAEPIPELPRPEWASLAGGFRVARLQDAVAQDVRPTLFLFIGAVALLLAVTCANLVLLLLARGARRRSEFAMRVALGAGRGRLARYLLTESLLLASLGCAVGLVLARAGLWGLVAASPPSLPRVDAIRLDGSALALALALTWTVGALFGLAPGLHRAGARPQGLREAGRGSSLRGHATRRALVVTEVALAMILLVGTGLILRSTRQLYALPLGFAPTGRVVLQIHATGLGDPEATHDFFDRALERVRSVPGVMAAAETSQLPLSGEGEMYGVVPAGSTGAPDAGGPAYRYAVSPGYFETAGIGLVRGRALQESDRGGAAPVAVVSERLARRLFGNADPLGRTLQVGMTRPDPYTVVGVVDDVKQASLDAELTDGVYTTARQWHWADPVRWMVVQTEGDPMAQVPAIRAAIGAADPNQPVVRAQPLEAVVARSEARRRFALVVMGAFASAAATLAVLGLYGVLSGMVVERLPELGVRAALGASGGNLVGLVVRQGLVMTAAGLALGLGGAAVASRTLSTLLYRVSGTDPFTYASVAGFLLVGALLASTLPAVRAARADPVRALESS